MKNLTLIFLRLYKRLLSPSNFGLKVCRFEPSCSKYTYQAIEKYGMVRGVLLGTKRVLKCNPLFKGGYDPVR